MKYELNEKGLGGILDQGINLVRDHFKLLFTISCYMAIPFGIVHALVVQSITPDVQNGPPTPEAALLLVLVNLVFVFFILMIITPLTNGATIYAVASEYLGRSVTAKEALLFAWSRFGSLLWASFLSILYISLGFICLIIPGIYLSFKYWFTTHVVIIEDAHGSSALKRSGKLMKDHYGVAFVLGLVLGILGATVGGIAGIAGPSYLSAVIGVVLQTVVFIVATAAGVVFYFSTRCHHENFDLSILAHAISSEEGDTLPETIDEPTQ